LLKKINKKSTQTAGAKQEDAGKVAGIPHPQQYPKARLGLTQLN